MHHVHDRRFEWGAPVPRLVCHHDHGLLIRREAAAHSQIFADVVGIVPAAFERMLRSSIVDADQQRLPARRAIHDCEKKQNLGGRETVV